jgi:DNA-binding NtrC family response regulator
VLPLRLPPLRERLDDIPRLAAHFLADQAQRDGRPVRQFSRSALRLLTDYHWPGNVRELQNICERAGVLAVGDVIDEDLIGPWLNRAGPPARPEVVVEASNGTLEDVERQVILNALNKYDGHRQRTARALGIGVRTLGLKLRKWKEQELVAESV